MLTSGALIAFLIAFLLALPIFIGWTLLQVHKIRKGQQVQSARLVSTYVRNSIAIFPVWIISNVFMFGIIGMGGDSPLVYASLGIQFLGNLLLLNVWWKCLTFFKNTN